MDRTGSFVETTSDMPVSATFAMYVKSSGTRYGILARSAGTVLMESVEVHSSV